MEKLNLTDIGILSLGIKNMGRIDGDLLEKSELNAGTGRLLDVLASLTDRGLLSLNGDKSFQITDAARLILWNKDTALWFRILRVLEMSPLSLEKISGYLDEDREKVNREVENLRKNHAVMMSALQTDKGLERTFEILLNGIDRLEKIDGDKTRPRHDAGLQSQTNAEIFELLTEITQKVKKSSLDDASKKEISEKLFLIKSKLTV